LPARRRKRGRKRRESVTELERIHFRVTLEEGREKDILVMEENRKNEVAKGVIKRNGKGKWLRIDSGFSCTAKRSVFSVAQRAHWLVLEKVCQQFLSMDGDI